MCKELQITRLWAILRFLWTVLIHKLYIFYYGLVVVGGIPLWQLMAHDLSKFTPTELDGYSMHLFARDKDKISDTEKQKRKYDFDWAFDHHQLCNGHHPQHWLARTPNGKLVEEETEARDMPEVFVREMVCDWMAANASYRSFGPADRNGRVNHKWLEQHLGKMTLTAATRRCIAVVLIEVKEMSPALERALRLEKSV